MSNVIGLKSKLLRAGDPMEADISQFKVPLTVDEAVYERDLLNFRRRFAVTEEAEEVAAQDTVTLTCRSELPRFCKEHVGIRVGQGLFSRELENQLIGWKKGQSGAVTVKEKPVEVTVERIQRETLPEVDDALAARCGMPGIRTAADIHRYCRGKQFDETLGDSDNAWNANRAIDDYVIATSEFELDPDELKFCEESTANAFRSRIDMDSMTDEEFQEQFSDSKENMLTFYREIGRHMLLETLLGLADRERAGRLPTEDEYAAWLRRYMDLSGKSEEQVRAEHPHLDFLMDTVAGEYMDKVEALTLQRLKEDL